MGILCIVLAIVAGIAIAYSYHVTCIAKELKKDIESNGEYNASFRDTNTAE